MHERPFIIQHIVPPIRLFRSFGLMAFLFFPLFPSALPASDLNPPYWRRIPNPVRSHITAIDLSSHSDGYAVSKNLLKLSRGAWELWPGIPWTSDLHAFHDAGGGIHYASTLEPTNESHLYRYDGRHWRRMQHPMMNFITVIALKADGRGWLGGWGELIRYDGSRWHVYPPVPNIEYVQRIIGTNDDNLRIFTHAWKLYRFSQGAWVRDSTVNGLRAFIPYGPHSAFAVAGDAVWRWNNGIWTEHSRDPLVASLVTVRPSGEEVWGVGEEGTIARYRNGRWQRVASPVKDRLLDIAVIGSRGWIVGDNGVVLEGSAVPAPPVTVPNGFRVEYLFRSGRGLEGEYGTAMEDLNGDGALDLYTVSLYNQNLLFINQSTPGKVLFRDESAARNAAGGEADTNVYTIRDIDLGVGIADADNDGDREIFLTSLVGHNSYLLNTGGGYFLDVSHQSGRGMGAVERSNSVSFADVDNDGDLEMFVANENRTNRLYENDGNGFYRDVTAGSGLATQRGGMCAAFGDLDRDGRSDLVVSFWTDRCRVYRNETEPGGLIRFREITDHAGLNGGTHERSNGVALGDIDNDGDLDLCIMKRRGTTKLYRNNGTGSFTDISAQALGTDTLAGYGAVFADVNNDGFLDLYLSSVGANRLYVNNGHAAFSDRSYLFGVQHPGYNTGISAGDVDADGDIDLYAATYMHGSSGLYVNLQNDSASIMLLLEGTVSNRDAVGAYAELYPAGRSGDRSALLQFREVASGTGYASHSSLALHFGVDRSRRYDVRVVFPASGIVRTFTDLPAGTRMNVAEEQGMQRASTLMIRSLKRGAIDPGIRTEALKLLLLLGAVSLSAARGRRRNGWKAARQILLHAPVLLVYALMTSYYFYDQSLLSVILPGIVAVTSLVVTHLAEDRRMMKELHRREKETTRRQIARDLHDDIASTLSSATIYLNVFRRSLRRPTAQQSELMEKVEHAIAAASDGMTDIVWTIAPKHDTLGDLITRIRMMVNDAASATGLQAEFSIDPVEEHASVSDLVRRNLYLILKEGMANIRAHARANTVRFTLRRDGTSLILLLEDDGVGLRGSPSAIDEDVLHGNGIGNMESRAQEIGAQFRLESRAEKGTTLSVSIEMSQMHH